METNKHPARTVNKMSIHLIFLLKSVCLLKRQLRNLNPRRKSPSLLILDLLVEDHKHRDYHKR